MRRNNLLKIVSATIVNVALVALIVKYAGANLTVLFYAAFFMFVTLWGLLFYIIPRLDTAAGTPKEVLQDLAHRLRSGRYRVTEEPGKLSIQITPLAAIKVHAVADGANSEILYQADATPGGWTVLVLLFLFTRGFAGFPMALYHFLKARRFAEDQLRPQLPKGGVPRAKVGAGDIRERLIDSLSEGHRLAAEAYEATQSRYEDRWLLLGFGAVLLWLILLVTLGVGPHSTLTGNPAYLLIIPSAITLAILVPSVWSTRKWFKPRIDDYREWADRLRKALEKETVHETTESPESSAFELIAQAYRQVPTWLEARRKGSFSRESGAWMLIFTCAIAAAWMAFFGIVLYSFTTWSLGLLIWSLVLLIGAAALISLCYLLYSRLRRRANEEGSRTLKDWNYRLDVMHQKMVKYLEEL
jgi:hypothetical protein